MVSVDNVNLDVLELVFAHLSGNDLASIALVSRSFFAGVIPRLYSTLLFRLSHAKRYPRIMTPFAAVAAHPEFAIHVRHVDIRTVPIVKAQYHPKFLLECARALELCRNITSFRCSHPALPPFLPALEDKERLREFRICAKLTTEQSLKLIKLSGIRNLTLDSASWNLLNVLPKWIATLQNNITTLTLFMASELNDVVLGSVLEQLPGLLGLHVIGCPKIDHIVLLGLLSHSINLESLSLTTGENSRVLPTPPPCLPSLRNLAIDVRFCSSNPPSSSVVAAILTYLGTAAARLGSFVVKYPDRQMVLPAPLVAQLTAAHGAGLRNASFIDCVVGAGDSLPGLCRACPRLERLEIAIPVRDLTTFTLALAKARALRVLVDVAVHTHSPRPTLVQDNVRYMFTTVPTLRKIVSDGRIWTVRRGELAVGLERRAARTAGMHWFMPR
ncbi:hypothetical protein GGX14DRAFT_498367, partial [Mycena pura]